jgi:hypothetical protein
MAEDFIFEPDWGKRVSESYKLETAIKTNEKIYEQRRPLVPEFIRETKASFVEEGYIGQRLFFLLQYIKDKEINVPIYSELMTGGAKNGLTTIVVDQDITYYWNLQNLCSYVIIINWVDDVFETRGLTSVAGSTLTLTEAITGTYANPKACTIYPVYIGFLKDTGIKHLSDNVFSCEVNFEEL